MPRLGRRSALACAALLLAGAPALPSCARSPTRSEPPPTARATVTAVVRDSLGGVAAYAPVSWVARFDSAGFVIVIHDLTDDDGECARALAEGGWIVTAGPAGPAGQVAGASFVVRVDPRAPAETSVVRLALHTASRATGRCTLAGRTEHDGTIVSAETGSLGLTDSSGAWTLEGLPLGRWPVTMYHLGFKLGLAEARVTQPGSVVVVPDVSLISDP